MTISATIIADSISRAETRITTFELEYPRFIHAEFMTHRMFSRNAASSRAIPVNRAVELIKENTAMPIHWGKNQPGMSAKEECDTLLSDDEEFSGYTREEWWNEARNTAIARAQEYSRKGYHKQIVNRLLEPFSHIKVVCTATDYDNFFWLRNHPDAQPEIAELARVMLEARNASQPVLLEQGEWHVPYVNFDVISRGHFLNNEDGSQQWLTLEDALAVSASCCAQVSYRKLDDSLEKARDIYKRLVDSKPVHASPFEHQATPIDVQEYIDGYCDSDLPDGITHASLKTETYQFWSGNFRNWIQHRQLIPDHTCWEYKQ